MATKFKDEKKVEFKSVDRDIRYHEWEDANFDIQFNDTTCPFTEVLDQIKEPGYDYAAAYCSDENIAKYARKGWFVVDPALCTNKKLIAVKDIGRSNLECISVGDTIIMARRSEIGRKEEVYKRDKYRNEMLATIKQLGPESSTINPNNPFMYFHVEDSFDAESKEHFDDDIRFS